MEKIHFCIHSANFCGVRGIRHFVPLLENNQLLGGGITPHNHQLGY